MSTEATGPAPVGGEPRLTAAERRDEARVERWERWAFWPLLGASLLFLVAYAWPILDPSLARSWRRAATTAGTLTWAVFVADYVGRLVLSPRRTRFVRRNPLDLAVVLLPALRPLQLLRVLSVLNRAAGSSLRGRVAGYVVGATVLVVAVGSLATLDAERRDPAATIDDLGDALWWAVATVTTVGYGDEYPVTPVGRAVAVALMLSGIALLGVVTASLASWLLDRVATVEESAEPEQDRPATRGEVAHLAREVTALRKLLERQGPGPPEGPR